LSEKRERRVALKIINKKRAPVDFQQKFLPRELETMKLLNHPNIIKLYDVIYIKDKVIFLSFYPRYAMLARSLRQQRVRPSVCPSVRLSVAGIVPSRAKAGS